MTRTDHSFDYIVVGGGAAGCVLAARLATDSDASVLLLERGNADTNRWIHVPATFFKVLQSADADMVVSEPDASLDDKPFPVPQGRVLGGGSSVNGMIYMRGQLVVDDPAAPHPIAEQIIAAAHAAGVPATDDFNGAEQGGAGWYQVTAHAGQRQSAAHCFLKPAQMRENLQVWTSHLAARIRFNGRRASALECFDAQGHPILIEARREIILTAGSFHSPKLLMLSGIGPRAELRRHGVELVHDAADVGQHYQDHVGAPVTRRLKDASGLFGADSGLKALKHGLDYLLFKRGLLTSNLLQAGACVDTDNSGRPDVQYNFAPFAPGSPGCPPLPFHAIQVHPMTMRPASRGHLGLMSSDPRDPPSFHASALAHESDLDALRRGVRLARDICEQPPLRDLLGEEVWPGKAISTAVGSNTLDGAIRAQARTIFHPAGTCRMGPDASAVVDVNLCVNGVTGLRVADCSIMPALVSGNTNAPTMMIADRCADALLAAQ
ncbi:MAG: GMC oxidoreductase [Pseudomonadota bacterium]